MTIIVMVTTLNDSLKCYVLCTSILSVNFGIYELISGRVPYLYISNVHLLHLSISSINEQKITFLFKQE